MQPADPVGSPLQLGPQQLRRQVVVAEPLVVVVQWDDEQVLAGERRQQLARTAAAGDRLRQRRREPLYDGRLEEEGQLLVGQLVEHLAGQVAGDRALVSAQPVRPLLGRQVAQRQCAEVDALAQPSVASRIMSTVASSTARRAGAAARPSRRGPSPDRRPGPRAAGRRPRRRGSARAGSVRELTTACAPSGRLSSKKDRLDQHRSFTADERRPGPARRAARRRARRQGGAARARAQGARAPEGRAARWGRSRSGRERHRKVAEQHDRVVVGIVDLEPGPRAPIGADPLRERKALAGAGGADTTTMGSPAAVRSVNSARRSTSRTRGSGGRSLERSGRNEAWSSTAL